MKEWLRIGANIASILTSIIAVGASVVYWENKRSKRTRLERYLKAKKERSPNDAFSATRLMADLGMTEEEIFAASIASRTLPEAFGETASRDLQRRCCSSIEKTPRLQMKRPPTVLIWL